jgi:hypothetical protein
VPGGDALHYHRRSRLVVNCIGERDQSISVRHELFGVARRSRDPSRTVADEVVDKRVRRDLAPMITASLPSAFRNIGGIHSN